MYKDLECRHWLVAYLGHYLKQKSVVISVGGTTDPSPKAAGGDGQFLVRASPSSLQTHFPQASISWTADEVVNLF